MRSAQYGAYHHNPVNIAIHICCVPLILFSAFWMVRLPSKRLCSRPDGPGLVPTVPT